MNMIPYLSWKPLHWRKAGQHHWSHVWMKLRLVRKIQITHDDNKLGLSIKVKRFLSLISQQGYKYQHGWWIAPLLFWWKSEGLPDNSFQASTELEHSTISWEDTPKSRNKGLNSWTKHLLIAMLNWPIFMKMTVSVDTYLLVPCTILRNGSIRCVCSILLQTLKVLVWMTFYLRN